MEDHKVAAGVLDLTGYDELVTTKDTKMIDAFSSHIIHVRTRTAYTGVGLNAMTQALCVGDGSICQGLMIQNAYMEMHDGSKNVNIVVRNIIAISPDSKEDDLSSKSSCSHMDWHGRGIRRGCRPPDAKDDCKAKPWKLFEKLDLSVLDSWPLNLADSAQSLFAEYHNIFSLEPSKHGCTHSTKHMIKVTDDTPFKE